MVELILLVKLETTGDGVTITGIATAQKFVGDGVTITGIATAQKFIGDGSELTNLPPAGSDLVTYASASNIANSAESISGISTYNQVGILTGSYASDYQDWFGSSVATSADGKTIVVGAKTDKITNVGASGYGIVYVFDREGNNFTELDQLTGFGFDFSDRFGESVACSADGKTIFVGAIQDETPGSGTQDYGLVHIFDRKGNEYHHVGFLTGSYASESGDNFGESVACSADGKTIVVGAIGDETSGTGGYGLVYVFDREGNNFNEVGILTGSNATHSSDQFGSSVATSADGKTIVVGAIGDETSGTGGYGLVYVFDREGNNFNEVGILTGTYASDANDYFGNSVATSADGKTIVVGAYNDEINPSGIGTYGVVYIFNREGNNFNEVGILTGSHASDDDDRFGDSVAISADGKNIIVGAHRDELPSSSSESGVVYVFDQERETYVFSDVNGNIGIGSAQPTAKLDVAGGLNVSGNVGIGSTIPAYTLDLGESPSTIRLVSDDGGTAIRMGAGDQNHDFTMLRVDGATGQHDGESASQAYGFSLKYIGSLTGNNNKLRIVADNQTGTPINAFTMLQDGSVGINSINPTATLDVNGSVAIKNHSIVSITTSHTASAGTPFTIDTFATSENDLAEYTIHVGYGNTIQAQKVLVMHDGSTAYSQEYAVMSQPSKIVSIEAFVSGSNVLLRATPETGVSGITTYKIVRGGLV